MMSPKLTIKTIRRRMTLVLCEDEWSRLRSSCFICICIFNICHSLMRSFLIYFSPKNILCVLGSTPSTFKHTFHRLIQWGRLISFKRFFSLLTFRQDQIRPSDLKWFFMKVWWQTWWILVTVSERSLLFRHFLCHIYLVSHLGCYFYSKKLLNVFLRSPSSNSKPWAIEP